jgi:hypothetical protein
VQYVDLILDDPVYAAVVVLAIRAILAYQRGLTYTEYRSIHALKRRWFPILDRVLWPRFVHEKGGREDAEYLRTVEATPREVFATLVAGGGSPHVVASVKRQPDGRLSRAHVVWRHGDGRQTEAYAFDLGDGTTAVYAHEEPSVLRLRAHLDGSKQVDGDPRGVVSAALETAESPENSPDSNRTGR